MSITVPLPVPTTMSNFVSVHGELLLIPLRFSVRAFVTHHRLQPSRLVFFKPFRTGLSVLGCNRFCRR